MLNNDRKIGLIEETAHGLQYAAGSVRNASNSQAPKWSTGIMV